MSPDFPSGRAPYARPVLKQVVTEVLAGLDPTKPARSTSKPDGENKPADGILYSTLDPTSRVRQLQNERPLDQLTNNHLVRHRMLILDRLLDDILAEFGVDGQPPLQVAIEVARELSEYSGKDRRAIKTAEYAKIAQHKSAEKHLKDNGITPNYSLIRKCRIAMDLNWTCPFTHRSYGVSELAELQYEHIIPRSKRLSDSMAGLVLTRPEINAIKGNRTALRFILDHSNGDLIVSPEKYKKWVDSLRVARKETYPDDYARQNARKRLLMIEEYEDKERSFTEGQLTLTSQIMKLAMRAIQTKLPNCPIHPIPGSITAEVRKAWKLTGTLAIACPEVLMENGDVRLKDEIRGMTHLHHSLDAATIALIANYFPVVHRGQNQAGKLWVAMRKRNRNPDEEKILRETGLYKSCPSRIRNNSNDKLRVRLELVDLDSAIKNKLARSLAECRVMQHVPADRSGTKAEQTTWSIIGHEEKYTIVLQRTNRGSLKLCATNTRIWEDVPIKKEAAEILVKYGEKMSPRQRSLVERGILKLTKEPTLKLLGPNPCGEVSKLQPHGKGRGAIVIQQNFAIALDPAPRLIPFHQVNQTLDALKAANGGKRPRLLRNGTLIRVAQGTWKGFWRISSVKNSEAYGISVDLSTFHGVKTSKGNAKVPDMIRDGLEILPNRYTGHPMID